MQYRIKINNNHGGNATVTIFEQGIDFAITINPIETMGDFLARVEKKVEEEIKNQIKIEKKSLPNPTIKEKNSEDKAKDAQVKYYESRGYIEQVFTGKAGSGKSTKGGAYAQENNYKICKVIEYPEKEVWFYKAKDGE